MNIFNQTRDDFLWYVLLSSTFRKENVAAMGIIPVENSNVNTGNDVLSYVLCLTHRRIHYFPGIPHSGNNSLTTVIKYEHSHFTSLIARDAFGV